MKKQVLSIMLTLCMLVTLVSVSIWAYESSNAIIVYADSENVSTRSSTSIGNWAYYFRTDLVRINIEDGVTSIGSYAFCWCTNLTSVTIPNSMTEIKSCAFMGCDKLKDVYYDGSESEWKAISIGSDNKPLLNATIHYSVPSQGTTYDIQKKTIKFNETTDVDLNWGWSLFDRDASLYSHDIAMAALILSNATELSESEARTGMEALGFENIESVDYDHFFAVHMPAAVFGSQKVTFADGAEKFIIAMNIRGTNDIGDVLTDASSLFNGFLAASQLKMVQLCEYISGTVEQQYGCSLTGDNTILFISGHSLGGATAGLLSNLMMGFAKQENTFVYTFASPNYDTQGNVTESYVNVHNIINIRDIVPNVPPGYKRYGHDWYYDANDCIEEAARVYGSYWDYYINNKNILYNHFLQTYLACMLSGVPVNMGTGTENPYNLSSIHCPVDIEVLDSNGAVIGWTEGQTVYHPDMNDVLIMTDGDAKYVWTPIDRQHTIRFVGTDKGTMSFSQQTFDMSGTVIDEKLFKDVRLTDQKTMSADIGGEITASQTRLFVIGKDEETKTAEIQEDGTEFLLKGDINKDSQINLLDAMLALKAAVGINPLDEDSQAIADVDNNGVVDLIDAKLVLKRAVGIIQDF